MVKEFKFPDLGEGVTEGEIKKWLVKEGDVVKKDQSIAEVETDKAVVEMPSPFSGRMAKLNFPEGGIVHVGEVLAVLDEEGGPAPEVPQQVKESVSVVGELPESDGTVISSRPPAREVSVAKGVQATPAVRKLAKDMDIDLGTVTGTGPGGRITEDDLKGAATAAPAGVPASAGLKMQPKFDVYGWIDRKPVRGVRRSTAKHMVEAQTRQALVTTTEIADVTDLVGLREKVKKYAEEVKGVKLTYLPFVIKAVVAALKKHPYLNSSMDEETEEIVLKKYYNLGIAVATEEGLIVPVVKSADQKEIFSLAQEIKELAEAAASRKIDLADLKGGTFSITNYGAFGGIYATPIPNYPEAAILGMGRIQAVPLVQDGEVSIRKVLYLSLTFDHRIMDGAQAATFLNDLKMFLENPELPLMDP
jgi:pyruvate dehydrogenase E2 component (dihydrolipoyllysine-residue acetyltransferase)